jgi:hypothetical protein
LSEISTFATLALVVPPVALYMFGVAYQTMRRRAERQVR